MTQHILIDTSLTLPPEGTRLLRIIIVHKSDTGFLMIYDPQSCHVVGQRSRGGI